MLMELDRYRAGLVVAGVLVSILIISGCTGNPVDPVDPTQQSITPADNTLESDSFPLATTTNSDEQAWIDREILVMLDDDVEASIGKDFFKKYDVEVLRIRPLQWGTLYCLSVGDSSTVPDMVSLFEKTDGVHMVQPNYKRYFDEAPYYPNDPMWENDDDGDNDPRTTVYEMWGPAKLGASIVWNESKGSSDIVVAIIDTGIDYDHEDLHDNLWMNEDEDPSNGIDDDGNGYIDDWWGWNCWQMNNDPNDDGGYAHFHGTGCAGVVAAVQDNLKGLCGIAPGIKLMAVKVLFANNYTSDETIMEALNYVTVNGADIVSMSFGGTDMAPGFHEAIQAAWDNGNNGLLIASAGNADNQNYHYPASYDEVMAVSATVPFSYGNAPVDERRIQKGWAGWWWGSSYGDWVSISGFGEKYMTTRGSAPDAYWDGVNYWFFNGTSCACPTVAGTAALMMTFHPNESATWYWSRLEDTADDLETPGFDIHTGNGRVNALRAVYGSDRYAAYEDADGFVPIVEPNPDPEPELFDSIHDRPGTPFHDTEDLYKLTPQYDGKLTIDFDIFSWGENLDFGLYSDQAMTNLLAGSTLVNHADSSIESVNAWIDGETDYYLKVWSPAEGNSTTYGLDLNYDYNTLIVTGDSLTPLTAEPGLSDLPFIRLNFDVKYAATLDGLDLHLYSTSVEDILEIFKLYRDTNSNGVLDGGDSLIAIKPEFSPGLLTFSNLNQAFNSSETMYLFITANISTNYPYGSQISLGLESADDLVLEELLDTSGTEFPIKSGVVTIED